MIPSHEITLEFSRSGGPGGQNVNKTATKAVVHWNIGAARSFTPEQKTRIRMRLKNRLNFNDELVVSASAERSQSQNRARAMARLNELVSKALIVNKKRRPTRPTKASKLRRLEHKWRRSLIKRRRKILE